MCLSYADCFVGIGSTCTIGSSVDIPTITRRYVMLLCTHNSYKQWIWRTWNTMPDCASTTQIGHAKKPAATYALVHRNWKPTPPLPLRASIWQQIEVVSFLPSYWRTFDRNDFLSHSFHLINMYTGFGRSSCSNLGGLKMTDTTGKVLCSISVGSLQSRRASVRCTSFLFLIPM